MPDLVPRIRLTALRAALMRLHLNADVLNFFAPGELDHSASGKIGP